ncbi:MAG: hypothetical protein KJO07_09170 [Deltaproteobacteria bacterium]|jgi:diadenosine tetraphosphate (Ap4A) HIT family hydrolase|nr:hypothetical protein [Deltaproteobacteria bacterium]
MGLRWLLAAALTVSLVSANAHGKGARRPVAVQKKASSASRARPAVEPQPRRRPGLNKIQRLINPWKQLGAKKRSQLKGLLANKLAWVRARGKLFGAITQKRDYRRDYVVVRNRKVTAFLDWSDPHHPQYDPTRKTGEQHLLDPIPESRRAHVLVVPNRPREHIAQRLGEQISLSDLDAARETMQQAHAIAKKLGINKPRIWINSPDRISVGYLHVHIIGERKKAYPPALEGRDQAP